MLDNLIEAAEAITFWTETQTKNGRKYDKKVAIALWPQGEESTQTPHTCSSQYEDNDEHDAGMPDSVPNMTSRPHKVRIYRNSIPSK